MSPQGPFRIIWLKTEAPDLVQRRRFLSLYEPMNPETPSIYRDTATGWYWMEAYTADTDSFVWRCANPDEAVSQVG